MAQMNGEMGTSNARRRRDYFRMPERTRPQTSWKSKGIRMAINLATQSETHATSIPMNRPSSRMPPTSA